jgi:hypothetical protein
MKLLPLATGRVFDTSAAVDVAMVFVWIDMHFVRFTGPMDLTEGWVIGVPIPSVAGVTDSDALRPLLLTVHYQARGCDQFD